jgi:hypothetical protein
MSGSLLQTLLGYLNRVFDKDPHQFLGLRVDYGGSALTWTVAGGTLTLESADGFINISVALAGYTIASLAALLSTYNSLTVTGIPMDGTQNLSALTLIEGSNSSDNLNGDCIYAYSSLVWAYMGAMEQQLTAVAAAILALPLEMSTNSADGEWLDFIGGYYGVPRLPGEPDQLYGPRIPAEVVAPASNSLAIAQAITNTTGQPATVTDVIEYGPAVPEFNGEINFDGSHDFNASALPIYGLFDVAVGFDILNGGDPAAFEQTILAQVVRIRAAGTQLRNLTLQGGVMSDGAPAIADSLIGTWSNTDGMTYPA